MHAIASENSLPCGLGIVRLCRLMVVQVKVHIGSCVLCTVEDWVVLGCTSGDCQHDFRHMLPFDQQKQGSSPLHRVVLSEP
jgi:hypothetical protein